MNVKYIWMNIGGYVSLMVAAGVCAVAAVSCDKPAGPGEVEYGDIPVTFRTADNWNGAAVSKAGESGDSTPETVAFTGNEFGVYAYYHAAGGGEAQPLMEGQLVERAEDGSGWTYSPIKYWPTSKGDKLEFLAYYPYTGDERAVVSKVDGYPSIAYTTVTTTNSDNSTFIKRADVLDLLVSTVGPISYAETEKEFGAAGRVPFTFTHAMADVSFSFRDKGGVLFPMELSKVEVTGVPVKGNYTYANGGTWEVTETITMTILPENSPITLDNNPVELFSSYLIPDGACITSVKVYVKDDGEDMVKNCDLSNNPLVFKANTRTSVIFKINPKPGVGGLEIDYVHWEAIITDINGTFSY